MKLAAPRRVRSDRSTTIAAILDATEEVMLDEGYAGVSTRRVAARAGLKPPLVHYYFPTTDDLLVAAYRRAAGASLDDHVDALRTDSPLRAVWTLSADDRRTRLGIEFMALANHRKVISEEIARSVEQARAIQAEAIANFLEEKDIDPNLRHPAGIALLLVGAARALVMENGVGISLGHHEARAIIEWCLSRVESPADQ